MSRDLINGEQLAAITGGVAARPQIPTKPTQQPRRARDESPVVKYDDWGAYIGDY
jgi:hypothetical protein